MSPSPSAQPQPQPVGPEATATLQEAMPTAPAPRRRPPRTQKPRCAKSTVARFIETWELFAAPELQRWAHHINVLEQRLAELDRSSLARVQEQLAAIDDIFFSLGIAPRAKESEGPDGLVELARLLTANAASGATAYHVRGARGDQLRTELGILVEVGNHLHAVLQRYHPRELTWLRAHADKSPRARLSTGAGDSVPAWQRPGMQAVRICQGALHAVQEDLSTLEAQLAGHRAERRDMEEAAEERKQALERLATRASAGGLLSALTGGTPSVASPTFAEDPGLQHMATLLAQNSKDQERCAAEIAAGSERYVALKQRVARLVAAVTADASIPADDGERIREALANQAELIAQVEPMAKGYEAALQRLAAQLSEQLTPAPATRRSPVGTRWYHLAGDSPSKRSAPARASRPAPKLMHPAFHAVPSEPEPREARPQAEPDAGEATQTTVDVRAVG